MNTPRTDAVAKKAITPNEADLAMGLNPYLDAAATMAELARDLERENARLRDALKAIAEDFPLNKAGTYARAALKGE